MASELDLFVHLTARVVLEIVALGFAGGVLSGLIGSGGAFLMVPGMIDLGLSGPLAVGSCLVHKFGRALVSFRRPRGIAHIDRQLTLLLLVGIFAGIGLATWLSASLLASTVAGRSAAVATANLYVSAIFVCSLLVVAVSFLRDALLRRRGDEPRISQNVVRLLWKVRLAPMLDFRVAETRVSLWFVLLAGLLVGYLAGTIGIATFFVVPAMVYLLGIPRPMVAGIEATLAVFVGAFGAACYTWEGVVDVRVSMLLFAGSLAGVAFGRRAGTVVPESRVRLVAGSVILGVVFSRAVALPIYAAQLGWLSLSEVSVRVLGRVSAILLVASGLWGIALTLYFARQARRHRRRIEATLAEWCWADLAEPGEAAAPGGCRSDPEAGAEA